MRARIFSCACWAGTATGVTFNTSETMTRAATPTVINDSGFIFTSEIYYRVNPTVTTANVTTSFSSNSHNDQGWGLVCLQFSGVDTASPVDANNGATGTSAAPAVSITTTTANAWIVDSMMQRDVGAATVGSGQTERRNIQLPVAFRRFGVSTVNGKVTPGAENMDWSTGNNNWATSALAFKPAASATPSRSMLMGVGP